MWHGRVFHGLVLELQADTEDRHELLRDLKEVRGTEVNVVPKPTLYDKWFYGHASSTDQLVNTAVTIIGTAGAIATLAQVVYGFLKSRRPKSKADTILGFSFTSPPPPNKNIPYGAIKIVRKETSITIRKDTPLHKIEAVLSKFSESGDYSTAKIPVRKFLLAIELESTKNELKQTGEAVSALGEVVRTFEKPPPLKTRQKRKLKEYQLQLTKYRRKAASLKSRVARLKLEINQLE